MAKQEAAVARQEGRPPPDGETLLRELSGRRAPRRYSRLKLTGWALLLLPVLILGYEIGKLTPVYLNYFKVSRSLEQAAAEYHEGDNPESLMRAIGKALEKEGVQYPQVKDITIRRDGAQWVVEAKYDDQTWLFFNVDAQVGFDKMVRAPQTVTQ
jgi:hypothetical protein